MVSHHRLWRLGLLRPFALASGAAFMLFACQSEHLQEGFSPPAALDSITQIGDSGAATASAVVIQGLTLSPTSATLAPGASITFTPQGWLASGPPAIYASVTWTAAGGTISSSGVYTAGLVPGTYWVKAKSTTNTWLEEAAPITITGTPVQKVISQLTLTPVAVALAIGAKQQFAVSATMTDGSVQANPSGVIWSATGGNVSSGGLYTAGASAGSYRVIAAGANGKSDTSTVTVTAPSVTVTGITVSPGSASLQAAQTQQFTASAAMSNGTTQSNPAVTWIATGGTISNSGLFTAGSSAGSYRVIAKSSNGKADTSGVTIAAAVPPPPQGGTYPNRPSNYTNSSAIDFSQPIPTAPDNVDRPISGAPGWYMIYFGNNWSAISDPSAPQSPPGVWQGRWSPGAYGGGVLGQGSGHGIGNVFTRNSMGSNHLYMSMRVYFDFDPSQWHSISNKFVNIETDRELLLVQLMEGGNWRHAEGLINGGTSWWVDPSNGTPGQVSNIPVPTRKWVQLEVLIDLPNKVFKVWQDGVLTTNARPPFQATKLNTVAWNAFRGGGGETLTSTLNYRYDQFFIAW